jgi:hypothetical protein
MSGELGTEREWNEGRMTGVEKSDLVYYSGHASAEEILLSQPNHTYFQINSIEGWEDKRTGIWGHGNLKWLAIAACGPLQDGRLTPVWKIDAFERWRVAFGGLRMLLGFSCEVSQTINGGRLFAKYATSGMTVLRAWLRAAIESQPFVGTHPKGPIYASCMYAYREKESNPYCDRLSPDEPLARSESWPDKYVLLSTTT